MKILIDARFYGLENAGLGRYVINLVEELKQLYSGFKIKDSRNKHTKLHFVVLLRKKYYKKLKFPNNWKKVMADFRHYTITEQLKLPIIIYQERPDLCHFPHFNAPIFYFGKYIVTLHDMEMHKFKSKAATTRNFFSYRLWRMGYNLVYGNAALRSKKIIVPSEVVRDEIQNYYKLPSSKFVVIYEGISITFLKNISIQKQVVFMEEFGLTNKQYFFYNGNAYPHKNLEVAIKAIKVMNKKGNNIHFVIASSRNVFTSRLEKIIKRLKVQKYIHLVGFLSDEELCVLHKNSIGFLYPSLMEGFGLQGLEAMASGTLVCASDIPIFKEIYKNHALYFNPKTENSIAKTLLYCLNLGQEKRKKLIISGKKFARKYSWSRMARETLKVYVDN